MPIVGSFYIINHTNDITVPKAIITQTNCLNYLKNDNADKLLLLDVPYISSEHTCGIKGFNYAPFHQKVSEYLQKAEYPFLYFCRSNPPKSDTAFSKTDAEHVMKMKLAEHFFDKGFYFEKVELAKDTELMVSNRCYDHHKQFLWEDFELHIL